MADVFDHYALLGIAPDASLDAIRAAFRTKARLFHPDRPGGDAMRFHEAYTAYRLLMDAQKRQQYDELRRIASSGLPLQRTMINIKRFVFPNSVAVLAKRGLMRANFRGRDRRIHTKIDYDMELPLSSEELTRPLLVPVPVTVRTICLECLGSDPHCSVCDGRGSCKSGSIVPWKINGGLAHGQIVELGLERLRPAPLSYYKKRRIRIKITKASA